MIKIHLLTSILVLSIYSICNLSFGQFDGTGEPPRLFYVDDETRGNFDHYDIPKDPNDTSLNSVFRKWGVVHVKDVIKTIMVHDYIQIFYIQLNLKKNIRKSFWEAHIEYAYMLPVKKARKNGSAYIDKWLSYNFIFIHALSGKIKRRKFKQTIIECY